MSVLKEAAEGLIKVADEIEKDAAAVTEFVCDKCNHTATLETINAKRREAAEQVEGDVKASEITVNDKIRCAACDGIMSYRPTEASAAYYLDDTDKQAGDEEDEGKQSSEPIDYDSLNRYAKKEEDEEEEK